MKDLHIIEHREFPVPDRGQQYLVNMGFNVRLAAPFRGEPVPEQYIPIHK